MTSVLDPEEIFGRDRQVHAITAWNPSPKFSEPAQQGMRLWSKKLEEWSEKNGRKSKSSNPKARQEDMGEVYTWFGKVSVSGALGMPDPDKWAKAFNEQIDWRRQTKKGAETHLYMYCGYFYDERPGSLHIGKVDQVVARQNAVFGDSKEESHTPMEFYQDLINQYGDRFQKEALVPLWFKITDIREIRKSYLENLERLTTNDEDEFEYKPFFTVNFNSPFPVYEKNPRSFFDLGELKHYGLPGWWEEVNRDVIVLHDSLSDNPDSCTTGSNVLLVPRRAKEMAECVSAVLSRSDEILFVDPYFSPGPNCWKKPLQAFILQAARRPRIPYRLEFHTCNKITTCSFEELARQCRQHLPRLLPQNWKMTIFQWEETDQPFHARFILTEKAGVLFEHGLSEGSASVQGDQLLVLLTPQARDERWDMFQENSKVYMLLGKELVRGEQ